MSHIGAHASTADLPDPRLKNEEYYYWEGGYYGTDNTEVLRVEGTVGPNGQENSYDAARPMSWYRTSATRRRTTPVTPCSACTCAMRWSGCLS